MIAEIGHNHQGSVERAQELFVRRSECGVDAVKLQKRDNRRLFTRALYDAPYDNENSFGSTYGQHREALELDRDAYVELRDCARELGLVFFATAFDEASADLLEELDLPAYKIASGDLRNTPLLRHVASFGKPMIISTGGATLEDVDRAVETVLPLNTQVCVLQCTAAYPAPVEELEPRRDRRPSASATRMLVIGLSDHQDGIAMSLVAYMLGARVIEKHFTLSHAAKGTDHAFSLMPEGMRKLVRDLAASRPRSATASSARFRARRSRSQKMGKKLVAARALPAGHVLSEGDLVAKSPADEGLPPYLLDDLLGQALVRPLAEEEAILAADISAGSEPDTPWQFGLTACARGRSIARRAHDPGVRPDCRRGLRPLHSAYCRGWRPGLRPRNLLRDPLSRPRLCGRFDIEAIVRFREHHDHLLCVLRPPTGAGA